MTIFQLPLSGSQELLRRERPRALCAPLSTPSLGITSGFRALPGLIFGPDFQLPLSGSLILVNAERIFTSSCSLSTPSLGITNAQKFEKRQLIVKAFNSLSRDHLTAHERLRSWSNRGAFNSLSRDHRARFRDFPALRGFLPRHLFARMIPKATIWIYLFAHL